MDVLDCVVASPEEYVERAVQLGTDPAARRATCERIESGAATLFSNPDEVREFEHGLAWMAAGGPGVFASAPTADSESSGRRLAQQVGPELAVGADLCSQELLVLDERFAGFQRVTRRGRQVRLEYPRKPIAEPAGVIKADSGDESVIPPQPFPGGLVVELVSKTVQSQRPAIVQNLGSAEERLQPHGSLARSPTAQLGAPGDLGIERSRKQIGRRSAAPSRATPEAATARCASGQ